MGLPSVNGELANSAVASGCSARRHAELLHHVGLARIIEVGLDGAGAQHHVEPERADARHVAQHDLVAALGHDRQLVAASCRARSRARGSRCPSSSPIALHLREVAAGLGAGLVQVSSGAPDSSNWPAGSRLIAPSAPDSAMTLPPFVRPAPSRIRSGRAADRGCRRARRRTGRGDRRCGYTNFSCSVPMRQRSRGFSPAAIGSAS